MPLDSATTAFSTIQTSESLQTPIESLDYCKGYEDGRASMLLEMQRIKDKEFLYQQKYLSTMKVIDSYISKAQLQLGFVNGDILCDINRMKSDIMDIKSNLLTLRELVNDLVAVEQQICQQVIKCDI